MEAKRKVGSSHETTTILKGATIVNYLHKAFQLLWLMKTLFVDRLTYSRITNLKITYTRFVKSPSPDIFIWKKCREWISPATMSAKAGSSNAPNSQITQ